MEQSNIANTYNFGLNTFSLANQTTWVIDIASLWCPSDPDIMNNYFGYAFTNYAGTWATSPSIPASSTPPRGRRMADDPKPDERDHLLL